MADNSPLTTEQAKPHSAWKGLFSWSKEKVFGTVVAAIFVGIVIGWWNHRAPNLRFTKGESFSFAPETGVISVTVANDGSMVADEVECELKSDACKIQKIEVKPTNLKATTKIEKDGSKADITIPRLNKTEKLEISITATNPYAIDKTLKVAVRGKDVVGKEANRTESSWFDFANFVAIASLAMVGWAALSVFAQSRLDRGKAKHAEDRIKRSPKIFRFLNGSLADKFVTGQQADDVYAGLSNRVTIGDEVYYIWSMSDNGNNYTFELVCDEVIPFRKSLLMSEKYPRPLDADQPKLERPSIEVD